MGGGAYGLSTALAKFRPQLPHLAELRRQLPRRLARHVGFENSALLLEQIVVERISETLAFDGFSGHQQRPNPDLITPGVVARLRQSRAAIGRRRR